MEQMNNKKEKGKFKKGKEKGAEREGGDEEEQEAEEEREKDNQDLYSFIKSKFKEMFFFFKDQCSRLSHINPLFPIM